MRSLIVTKVLPVPADNGGRQRTLAVLRALAARGEVVLCALDDGKSDIAELEAMGVDVRAAPRPKGPTAIARGLLRTRSGSSARFWVPALAEEVRNAASTPFDVVVVEYVQMAAHAFSIPAGTSVLATHNVESSLVDSYSRLFGRLPSIALGLEVAALRRLERRCMEAFDVVTVVSEVDRRRLPASPTEVLICPNGSDHGPALPPSTEPVAVFVASMDWRPNIDAARWLGREIWPGVTRRVRGSRLLLVGRNPVRTVRNLASPDVEVSGTVPHIGPYLARARVALAPLRVGGGSRLKILEALTAGRPVVATTKGIEGMEDLVGEGVVVADTEQGFADAISDLLEDPATAEALGRRGRSAVLQRYSWDITLGPLLNLLDGPRCGPGRR